MIRVTEAAPVRCPECGEEAAVRVEAFPDSAAVEVEDLSRTCSRRVREHEAEGAAVWIHAESDD